MRPISLRRRPPRDPRARLGGLMLLPRTIDKARGLIQGGDPGAYRITPGLSAWLLGQVGLDEAAFLELVRASATEDEVAAAVVARLGPERRDVLNELVRTMRVRDLSAPLRDEFLRLHGPQAEDTVVIDVLVADDRASFAPPVLDRAGF
jgi:hypothetical protein